MRRFVLGVILGGLFAAPAWATWDPFNGDWGKSDSTHVRVMTWNVQDGICSTANKQEGVNSTWMAIAQIVAALEPDVLLLQEAGDNSGNGTGGSGDSQANLATTVDLFLHGGSDPFLGGTVGAYVDKYAANHLQHIYVSGSSDGFNRNVVISRWPFADMNGDGRSTYNDIPFVSPHLYAPGGNGGIRGFMFTEINLDDAFYAGDLVVGCAHLKAFSDSGSMAERLEASQNVAYFIDHFYNGGGLGTPDPFAKISDNPQATVVLSALTPVVIGGDWNEDELSNGRKGPAEWLTLAQLTGGTDGTDRDRSDATYDNGVNPVTGDRTTQSGSKLDYIAWQDSIATAAREFQFRTSALATNQIPSIITAGFVPQSASGIASDHRPIIVDFILPSACAGDQDCDGVPDGLDVCPGFDDNLDDDGDGTPNGCDVCDGFDDSLDADSDGVPDGCDVCAGFDDNLDDDGDGVPNGCDICPVGDDNVDGDGDGVPNACDVCPGFDDVIDSDGDGVPDGCDTCNGYDDNLDIWIDGKIDSIDLSIVLGNFGTLSGAAQSDGDVDGDGAVDSVDLGAILGAFGLICP